MDLGSNRNPWRSGGSPTLADRLQLVGIVVLLGLLAAALLPTPLVWVLGGFKSREVFGSTSPDSRYRIAIAKRAEFPANRFLDHSILMHVTLSDARSGRTLDYISVGLRENSDFGKPKADWTAGVVRVRDLDDRHGLAVTLDVGAWESQ